MERPPLTRREFLRDAGAGAASATLLGSILAACGEDLAREIASGPQISCREPETDADRTFVAIADTIVPGAETDPAGDPGAVEGCVLNLADDPSLPVATAAGLLVTLADGNGQELFGRRFLDLTLVERTEVLRRAEEDLPLLAFAFRFFRSAHYAGLYNQVGPRSMGYPGGNLGFVDDPDFSFRRPVGRERTRDGNMP